MTVKRAIFTLLIGLACAAVPLQAIIDPTSENISIACLVLASSMGVFLYVGMTDALRTQPLSTMSVLGYCVTTHFGALIVQTAYWTPLSRNLYTPLYTFGAIVLYQWIAVGVHCVYRFFSRNNSDATMLRGMLSWMGLYRTPSVGALWFMGFVGLISLLAGHREGVVGKVGTAFSFLTWAPFLIPFYRKHIGEMYCDGARAKISLIVFTGAVVVIGLAFNARQVMFVGGLTIGLLYLISAMQSGALVTRSMVAKISIAAALLMVVATPLSDLATSMAIARSWRGKISPLAMIETTFHVWKNPALIEAYRAQGESASRYLAYDEKYIANPGLARLVSTKFIDNSFHFGSKITSESAQANLRAVTRDMSLAVMPDKVLHRLHIQIDKEELNYSMGDYMAYLSRGIPLGGRKTGSMFAHGQVLFGPAFPILYALICVVLFGLMDLLTMHKSSGPASICALGMLEIWSYFNTGISGEGLQTIVYMIGRNFEQMILIYAVVFAMARLLEAASRAILGFDGVRSWQQVS